MITNSISSLKYLTRILFEIFIEPYHNQRELYTEKPHLLLMGKNENYK